MMNRLTKLVYYRLLKTTIDVADLAEIMLNVVVRYHGLLKSSINNQGLLFTSKFSSLLCYFFGIK